MKQTKSAIHEAGHAVTAHYAGNKVDKVSLSKDGGETIFNSDGNGLKQLSITVAGFLATFMYLGKNEFLRNYPEEFLRQAPDIVEARAFLNEMDKGGYKKDCEEFLTGFAEWLASPKIYGKILYLADELRDRKNLKKDIGIMIAKCERERTPEYTADEFITWLTKF